MTRWSLGNAFLPVSHREFIDYTNQFKQAAEQSFGTECRVEIRALTAPKAYTSFADDMLQSALDAINDQNTLLKTETLSDITPSLWADAQYVEVILKPVDDSKASQFAFAHAEFKGEQPRRATFYIQPNGEDAKKLALSWQSGKIVGDGYQSNSSRSPILPPSPGRMWPF